MMELREPPRTAAEAKPDAAVRALLVLNLLAVAGLAAFLLLRPAGNGAADPERTREVASKLKAAGALDEAADRFAEYLEAEPGTPEARAKIAYSLGTTYMDRGQYEKALRWLYEAESLGAGSLAGDVGQKIVHALERLGRHHAAQAALQSRTRLQTAGTGEVQRSEEDPVVARIGEDEIHRSDLTQSLDEMPPEMARAFADPAQREELLEKYVADELLWRKAAKLEYDDDPQVRRTHAALLKQLAVSKFVEKEVLGKIQVAQEDLRNHFEANKSRFQPPPQEGEEPQPVAFEDVRAAVEQDYRRLKIHTAYQQLIDTELSTADVELYPERLADEG